MNTNLGYSKRTLTNTDVLLSGGGNKPLSEFIGSISWDATNRKIKYTPVGGSATDLVTLSSLAITNYSLPKSTTSALGGIIVSNVLTTAVTLTSGNGTTASRYYGVQLDKDGKAFVNIPWVWNAFTAATADAAGTAGYIQAPKGALSKFFRGDNTWQSITSNVTTSLYFGASNGTANAEVATTPYIILKEGSSYTRYKFEGAGGITVSSDASGNLKFTGTTYSVFGGASSSADGSAGLVKKPVAGDQGKFLRGDCTWQTINLNVTSALYVGASNGTSTAAQTAGNVHLIFAEGGTYTRYKITGSGRASVTSDANGVITINSSGYNNFTAATSSAAGSAGLVPGPGKNILGSGGYFLRADGSWAVPTNTWNAANSSQAGYVPKLTTGGGTIATQSTEYVLTFTSGGTGTITPTWKLLPANAFANTWTAWKGATDSANGTAGYMPAPTSAQKGQFLRGDGSWVSLNNYSLPTASNSKLGGVKTGAAITDTTGYTAVAIKDGVIYYKDTNTTYSFSNLLFLQTSGTNLMTYNSQAVRTVLAGSNITFTHSNNVLTIAAKDTTYSTVSKTAAGLCPTLPNETTTTKYLRLDGTWLTPPDNNTWKAANSSQEGYVPKSTANKILRANADGALYWGDDANTEYTFYNLLFQNSGGTTVDTYKPTTSPTKTLKAGSNVTISAASNIITIASTNTWNAMTGATSSANGTVGYVNAVPPKDGYNTKFLRADGTWSVPAYPTKSSWNYDDVYVKSVSISGNNLRINKNGSNTDLTIPYATNADTVDSLHASNFARFFLSPMTSGAPADSAKSWFTETMPSASGAIIYNVPGSEKTIIAGKSSGAYGHMLQLSYDDNYLRLLRYHDGSWKTTDWEKISAGYADSAGSVAWTNVSSKPETATRWPKWSEVTEKPDSFVYRGNISTDYVNGTFSALDMGTYSVQFGGYSGALYHFFSSGSTSALDFYCPTYSGVDLYFRKTIDNNRFERTGWTRIITSDNYSSYALPLSGGTVTGHTDIRSNISNDWAFYVYSPKSSVYLGYGGGQGLYVDTFTSGGDRYLLHCQYGVPDHGTGGTTAFSVSNNGTITGRFIQADSDGLWALGSNGWLRTYGNCGWYSESHGGGWYMNDDNFIKNYGDKPVHVKVSDNAYGGGGHNTAIDCYNPNHSSIGLRNNTCGWWICSNLNRNLYIAYRPNSNASGYSSDSYPAYITPAGAIYTNSDRRLKKNILDILCEELEDLINNVSLKKFTWKSSGKDSYGFIAQELKEIIPEAVDEDTGGIMHVSYNVAYAKIIASLIYKVKELESKIKQLENNG